MRAAGCWKAARGLRLITGTSAISVLILRSMRAARMRLEGWPQFLIQFSNSQTRVSLRYCKNILHTGFCFEEVNLTDWVGKSLESHVLDNRSV